MEAPAAAGVDPIAAALRNTTTRAGRQRCRLVSMNYASDLRFASRRQNGAPRGSHQVRDWDSTKSSKLLILNHNMSRPWDIAGSRRGTTFLLRSSDFAAIFDRLHENSVMH